MILLAHTSGFGAPAGARVALPLATPPGQSILELLGVGFHRAIGHTPTRGSRAGLLAHMHRKTKGAPLRHTIATWLLSSGVAIAQVGDLLGHADGGATAAKHYAKWIPRVGVLSPALGDGELA